MRLKHRAALAAAPRRPTPCRGVWAPLGEQLAVAFDLRVPGCDRRLLKALVELLEQLARLVHLACAEPRGPLALDLADRLSGDRIDLPASVGRANATSSAIDCLVICARRASGSTETATCTASASSPGEAIRARRATRAAPERGVALRGDEGRAAPRRARCDHRVASRRATGGRGALVDPCIAVRQGV